MGNEISTHTGPLDAAAAHLEEAAWFDGIPLDDPRKLGDFMWEHYRSEPSPDATILDEAIQATQLAVDLHQGLDDLPQLLFVLGVRFYARSMLTGLLDDLEKAISAFQRAADLTFEDNPELPKRLDRLGVSTLERFERIGEMDDLNSAATAFCCAVELAPEDSAEMPRLLTNYGASLKTRYARLGEIEDIHRSIAVLHHAVDLTPDRHPYKPSCCDALGNSLLLRFERTGDFEDLQQAIAFYSRAVELTSDGHRDMHSLLNNLGNSLLTRFERTGELEDIEKAISLYRRAVELMPDGHRNSPLRFSNLAISLARRFERTGKLCDLDQAISFHRRTVELTSDDPPNMPLQLDNLGNSLLTRFERTEQLDDLEQAILSYRHAIELTPDDHPDKPFLFSHLGSSLVRRFERIGKLHDVEQAIVYHRRAVELTPDGHPGKHLVFGSLGSALAIRYKRTGEFNDLEQAISLRRRAIEVTPDDHPDKLPASSHLSQSLFARSSHTGKLGDLEEAISMHRRIVELVPDDHPAKPFYFSDLGTSLSERYERTGELGNLEQAVSLHRRAVELMPDDHPHKPSLFTNLGTSLSVRFQRTGEHYDLGQAISAHHCAINLLPKGHSPKPLLVNSLASLIFVLYGLTGELVDLERAIVTRRHAIELLPDGHPDKAGVLIHLCNDLLHRFQRSNEIADIEIAIAAGELALELNSRPSDLWFCHVGVAECLYERFRYTGDVRDIKSSISLFQKAMETVPDGDPGVSTILRSLGIAQMQLCEHFQTKAYFDAAVESFIKATLHPSGDPSIRFNSAWCCILVLSNHPSLGSTDSLLSAHSRIIAILPEIVWMGHDIRRRYRESSQMGNLVNSAVSDAIAAGALARAVEWLEAGRALIWSQVVSLRTPLDDLYESYPELGGPLRRVQQDLQTAARDILEPKVDISNGVPRLRMNFHAEDRHRGLAIEYESLLQKIRVCPGFEDFLRPKSFKALTASSKALHGPVVFINVGASRCDALLLYPSGDVESVPLPALSSDKAKKLRAGWIEHLEKRKVRARGPESLVDGRKSMKSLRHTLKCLWMWIVGPVLDALDMASLIHDERLPTITWCPTGPLTQLPVHAAGVYNEPSGPRVHDFVVSSYTPSLSALLRSREKVATHQLHPNMLVLTQPDTPRMSSPLPGTRAEGRDLRDFLSESKITTRLLEHDQACTALVREDIGRYSWVHLACHGSQNQADATKSAFELYDGPLTLVDLMNTVAENAEFAFLSACQTAVGDEKIPEESAHLAAGMLAVGFKGVVATMWSIGDADAPVVVEAFYKELLALRKSGALREGETGAAYALHQATKVLREKVGENKFLRWVPFVHFGV